MKTCSEGVSYLFRSSKLPVPKGLTTRFEVADYPFRSSKLPVLKGLTTRSEVAD